LRDHKGTVETWQTVEKLFGVACMRCNTCCAERVRQVIILLRGIQNGDPKALAILNATGSPASGSVVAGGGGGAGKSSSVPKSAPPQPTSDGGRRKAKGSGGHKKNRRRRKEEL